jgi:hypothetical protein
MLQGKLISYIYKLILNAIMLTDLHLKNLKLKRQLNYKKLKIIF